VGCASVSIAFASTFGSIAPSLRTEFVMGDNPRTQQIYFFIFAFFIGATVLFEIGFFAYILRYHPNDPVLLGESSAGTTTYQALDLPQ
jgi:hypothetical protein